MPSESPVRGRHLEALRAVAIHPLGLRLSAHPVTMRALVELGLVVERQAKWNAAKPGEMARFLTRSGRGLIRALGSGDYD